MDDVTFCPVCCEFFDRYHAHLLIYRETTRASAGGYNPVLTTDPTDPRLGHGYDETQQDQNELYLVLPAESRELQKRVRPVRTTYVHSVCGLNTKMGTALAETYAADPEFYGSTYCCHCRLHRPVGEFVWLGTTDRVGT